MSTYIYTALNSAGKEVKGEIMAKTEEIALELIRNTGVFPVKIRKKASQINIGPPPKLSIKTVARFSTQMAAMLKSGIPIARVLEILKIESEDKQLRGILTDVFGSIQEGNTLKDSFMPYSKLFPVMFISMIEAGEAAGSLPSTLERAGTSFNKTSKINGKVKSAMIYPIVILTILIALIIFMLAWVMPQFTEIYAQSGTELPAFTNLLLDISDFIIQQWYIIIIFLILAIVGFKFYTKTEKGNLNFAKFKLNFPIIKKLIAKVYAARFCRTLSSLTHAGIPMITALNITARSIGNSYYQKEIEKMIPEIQRGQELSRAMGLTTVMPLMVTSVTKLGEESGELEQMLTQVSDYYEDEAELAIQTMLSLMEPVLIIIMAATVLPILLAALAPLFGMFEAMM